MKILLCGLWHLGLVTAACVAEQGHSLFCFDVNQNLVKDIKKGILPIYEPGLSDLIKKLSDDNLITFIDNLDSIPPDIDCVWITYDTPVDQDDHADTDYVLQRIHEVLPLMPDNSFIVISSQLPVGSIKAIENNYLLADIESKKVDFVCIPENLRLGNSLNIFRDPDRVVVGLRNQLLRSPIQSLFNLPDKKFVWMSIESAEMSKHAINAFLATSVVFTNELALLCEKTGANAFDVEKALKTESRIGSKAYVRPGSAFAGGTLARDVNYLGELVKQFSLKLPVLTSILQSNTLHKKWIFNKLQAIMERHTNLSITIIGLAYKSNTSTVRRSLMVEVSSWLLDQQATVRYYDPLVSDISNSISLLGDLSKIELDQIHDSDVLVIGNPCLSQDEIQNICNMRTSLLYVVDPNATYSYLANLINVRYFTVGVVV